MRALAIGSLAAAIAVASAGRAVAGSELPSHFGMYASQGHGPPLAMVASDVDVAVRGAIVEVTVTQTFRNDSDRVTEATYIFPLPADAAVSAMWMTIGSRTIHAAIASRGDARRRYEDAVSAGVGAAMLEQERADVFTQTVSAIPAHGTVAVTLRYDAIAGFHDGRWSLALPLVVAPRYVPGTASGQPTTGAGARPDTDRAPDASRVTSPSSPDAGGPTRIAVRFTDAVDEVTSPSHELSAQAGAYALTDPHSDRDVIVRWHAHDPARGWSEPGATAGTGGDAGYAAVIVEAPPAKPRAAAGKLAGALDVTLVIDRSAASLGDAAAIARPLVRAIAGALGGHDTLAFAGSDRIARQAPAAALAEVERGWSRPADAFDLTATLRALRQRGRAGAVVLITGGLVADDRAAIAAARALGVAIHVVGVGAAPNRALLAAIASASAGTVRIAAPDDDLTALARDVVADAASPPEPLAVNWGALAASDVVPATLPRLGAGQARLVVARVKQVRRANARAAGDVFAVAELAAEPALAGATSPLGPLARRWARDRLDEMVAAASVDARGDAKAIEAFALRYGLVSPYTAMVAIGEDVVETGGVKRSVTVPVSVPAGMRWQAVDRQDRVGGGEPEHAYEDKRDFAKQPASPPATAAPAAASPPPPPPTPAPAQKSTEEQDQREATRGEAAAASDDAEENKRERKPDAGAAPAHPRRDADAGDDAHERAEHATTDREDATDRDGANDTDSANGVASPPYKQRPASNTSPNAQPHDDEDTAAAAVPAGATALARPVATGTDAVDETAVVTSTVERRPWTFAVGLGGGVVAARGAVDGLGTVTASYDHAIGARTAIGVEGALWLAGSAVEGQLVADLVRGLPHVELAGGLGVHLGDGVGPVLDLVLRVPFTRHLAGVLRYDGALLRDDGKTGLDHAVTLGLEWRW